MSLYVYFTHITALTPTFLVSVPHSVKCSFSSRSTVKNRWNIHFVHTTAHMLASLLSVLRLVHKSCSSRFALLMLQCSQHTAFMSSAHYAFITKKSYLADYASLDQALWVQSQITNRDHENHEMITSNRKNLAVAT